MDIENVLAFNSQKMKVKLLKRVRKMMDYKFVEARTGLPSCKALFKNHNDVDVTIGKLTVHDMLEEFLYSQGHNAKYTWLDCDWYGLYLEFKRKDTVRNFYKS